ncbi:hypothetical protein NAEGRDRAFT_59377 [Naegleria gruberi]|uniref:SPRY domain-containing protein n=1 Tax=Naegleria gruberi TaxID=5762 RepID=D2VW27_NAEGR|nr:uncharacterized protein NAEGRDRAFT_59377 [Naegleria gruberi]EFC38942.1 hypothetical protein NAEGRDRAFT_59377 [Naegleria gruberi]|eukprot:XP_002671686.1 hypothetical protein NAEGRDRAFT_59377 [Naegleria gruberi strain NEG-M]
MSTTHDEEIIEGDDQSLMIGRFDITTLPLENQINIFWYCDERTLINVAQTNRGYHHLIMGDDDESEPEVNSYRNTIWKVRLLSELNRLIDDYNKSIIDNVIDTSLVHNLNENDLDKYVRNNLRIKEDRIRYSEILAKFKRLDYKPAVDSTEVSAKGRVWNNKTVYTWYSFLHRNYPISNDDDFASYCTFEGYEIVINQYGSSGGNDWNIVFGIGGEYEDFGKSNSIAEFTVENCGFGYIVNSNQFKIRGDHIYEDCKFAKDIKAVKVGDRFTLKYDRERKCIHFFKNGQHIVSVADEYGETLKPIVYYPIISMCVEMGVTFYPLLQVDYPVNENVSFTKSNFKFTC